VLKAFSFFEIDEYYAADIVNQFERASFDGKKVKVEPAQSKGSAGPRRKNFSKPAGREDGFKRRKKQSGMPPVRKKRRKHP